MEAFAVYFLFSSPFVTNLPEMKGINPVFNQDLMTLVHIGVFLFRMDFILSSKHMLYVLRLICILLTSFTVSNPDLQHSSQCPAVKCLCSFRPEVSM